MPHLNFSFQPESRPDVLRFSYNDFWHSSLLISHFTNHNSFHGNIVFITLYLGKKIHFDNNLNKTSFIFTNLKYWFLFHLCKFCQKKQFYNDVDSLFLLWSPWTAFILLFRTGQQCKNLQSRCYFYLIIKLIQFTSNMLNAIFGFV